MSAMYPLNWRPRRSPFAPYDPNDPEQGAQDETMYQPTPAPQPAQPPPQQGPPSMFTPAPTGPMPDFSAPKGDAYSMPEIPQAGPPQQAARSSYDAEPEPPRYLPPPKRGMFTASHVNDMAARAVDEENAHNRAIYDQRMTAWRQQQNLETTSQFYRNQPHLSSPYQKMVNGVPHNFAYNLGTGEEQDLGEAPLSSKNVSPVDVVKERNAGNLEATKERGKATMGAAQERRASALEVEKIKSETAKELQRMKPTGDKTKDDAIARRVIQGRAMVLLDPDDPSKGKVYDANLYNQLLSDYTNKGHLGMGELNKYEEGKQPPGGQQRGHFTPGQQYRVKATGQLVTADENGNLPRQ